MILDLVKMKPHAQGGTRLKFTGRDEQGASGAKSEATLEIVTNESYEDLRHEFGDEGSFRMRVRVTPEVMNSDGTPAIVGGATYVEQGASTGAELDRIAQLEQLLAEERENHADTRAKANETIESLHADLKSARDAVLAKVDDAAAEAKQSEELAQAAPQAREEDSPEDWPPVKDQAK